MIMPPSGFATGHTDMHRSMRSLAVTVEEGLKRDPMPAISTSSVTPRGDLVKTL